MVVFAMLVCSLCTVGVSEVGSLKECASRLAVLPTRHESSPKICPTGFPLIFLNHVMRLVLILFSDFQDRLHI